MSRLIIGISLVLPTIILLSSCKQYVQPTTAIGQKCVDAALNVKRACENERLPEIQACQQRNSQQQQIRRQQIETAVRNGQMSSDQATIEYLNVAVSQEYCSNLTNHCNSQYKNHFLRCGGRIE